MNSRFRALHACMYVGKQFKANPLWQWTKITKSLHCSNLEICWFWLKIHENCRDCQFSTFKVRHRNKRPHFRVGKKSLARLKIWRARQKILRPRHKIFKRVVGESWDAWKFQGRASFAIFPIEIFSQNFGCGHVRHKKIFSEKNFLFYS